MRTVLALAGFVAFAGGATTYAGLPSVAAAESAAEMSRVALTSVPSARQMASFYPVDAMNKHLAGRAVMKCRAPISGLLTDCQIVSATDSAFGAATLKIARFFLVRPATRDGQPVESTIVIPIVWKLAN